MVYATLEEAFGGISGSNFLSTRIKGDLHPVHRRRFEEEERKKEENERRKQSNNEYMCRYGDNSCQQVVDNNTRFNHQQKLNAVG